jgi:hypothetical protein
MNLLGKTLKSIKRARIFIFCFILLFCLFCQHKANAGGVQSYSGTNPSATAAISSGSGSLSSATINLEVKIPNITNVAIYDANGAINTAVFNNPTANFPGGTTFIVSESQGSLIANEGDLKSKFDLDLSQSADAALILLQMGNLADTPTQDLLIKGAIFSNNPTANIKVSTDINTLILAGGTGSSPQLDLRLLGGVPGGGAAAITKQDLSLSGMVLTSAHRNANGYGRFALIVDVRESSIDVTTNGSWTGGFTLTVIEL